MNVLKTLVKVVWFAVKAVTLTLLAVWAVCAALTVGVSDGADR